MNNGLVLPFRRRALHKIHGAMYWSGAAAAYRRLRGVHGAVILMYHSISDPQTSPWVLPRNRISPILFARQIRFLARHRHVISMTRLVEILKTGRDPEAGTVVLTFDDGYTDTLTTAAPILNEHRLSATVYLPTGYVDHGETNWADRWHTALTFRTRHRLDLRDHGGRPFDLTNESERRAAHRTISEILLTADRTRREALLTTLQDQLQPSCGPPRLTMTWPEVRELIGCFPRIDIGGHTVDHIDLRSCDATAARREITQCRSDIERELQRPPRHFSFPYSRSTPETCALVAAAGFDSAVAAGDSVLITPTTPRFSLPRIETPASMTLFRFWTSGAYPGLSVALTGRA